MSKLRPARDRWKASHLHRLTDEETKWFTALASTGMPQAEAFELARIACRRFLYLSQLTDLKEKCTGVALWEQVRDWIRGRRLPDSSGTRDFRPTNPSDLRRAQ